MDLRKPNKEKKWYAVFTKPKSEKKVLGRLEEEGIETFLPLVKTVRQWSDRKKMVEIPLISSYVFVHHAEADLNHLLPIQGIVSILKHLGKPAQIKDVEIENLRILCNSDEKNISQTDAIDLKKGDVVEVTKGSFMGLIAVCLKTNKGHRVVVKIESLGNYFNVNIPMSFLRKIENNALA